MNKLTRKISEFIKLIQSEREHIFVALLLSGFISATIPFVSLYFSAQILNLIVAQKYSTCRTYIFVYLTLLAVLELIFKACNQMISKIKEVGTRNIDEKIIKRAYTLEYEKIEDQKTMDTVRRAKGTLQGIGGVAGELDSLLSLISSFFMIIYSVFFTVMLFRNVGTYDNFFCSNMSTIVLIVVYIVISVIDLMFMQNVQKAFQILATKNDHNNSVGQYIADTMIEQKNGKDIRINALKPLLNHIYENYYEKSLSDYLKTSKISGKNYAIISVLGQVTAGMSYVVIGAKAVYGLIGVGDIFLYAGAINRAMNSLGGFMASLSAFQYKWTYLKGCIDFINITEDVKDKKEIPNLLQQHEIEFHDVSFKYSGSEDYVLNHINLKIRPDDKLAIVGCNGAGKTTLIKLLCGLYEPTSGRITLDGVDIKAYKFSDYTKIFSVIFQDFKLFSLPLDKNISAGKTLDEKRFWSCIDKVGLKERVEKMEDGIKTQMYNNNGKGIDVSGGEAQRFAIARALYDNANFIIMDEPTAALDPIAEAEIYEQFNQLVEGKTAIYISHRMSSCKFCDSIIVLNNGSIAEKGTHNELLQKQGIYAELFRSQAKYYIQMEA